VIKRRQIHQDLQAFFDPESRCLIVFMVIIIPSTHDSQLDTSLKVRRLLGASSTLATLFGRHFAAFFPCRDR